MVGIADGDADLIVIESMSLQTIDCPLGITPVGKDAYNGCSLCCCHSSAPCVVMMLTSRTVLCRTPITAIAIMIFDGVFGR